MKVAILSESAADKSGIRGFVEALLGTKTESPPEGRVRARGKDAIFSRLMDVVRHLHYHTDAAALCVVVDSDLTPIHHESHRDAGQGEHNCRLCHLKSLIAQVEPYLRPREHMAPLKIALGLAVPQIEAWYLVGRDNWVGEAGWALHLRGEKIPYRREELKGKVYGTDRPSLDHETECASKEAERIVRDGHLPLLEKLFPVGFGAFASDVRAWRTQG